MAVTEYFTEAVKKGNIQKIRIMMKNSLLSDTTFREFGDMEILTKNLPNLYDIHNKAAFIYDKNKWNESYLDQQLVQLMNNFSDERINHIKEIISFLYPISNKHILESKIKNGAVYKVSANMKKYAVLGIVVILVCIMLLIIFD